MLSLFSSNLVAQESEGLPKEIQSLQLMDGSECHRTYHRYVVSRQPSNLHTLTTHTTFTETGRILIFSSPPFQSNFNISMLHLISIRFLDVVYLFIIPYQSNYLNVGISTVDYYRIPRMLVVASQSSLTVHEHNKKCISTDET